MTARMRTTIAALCRLALCGCDPFYQKRVLLNSPATRSDARETSTHADAMWALDSVASRWAFAPEANPADGRRPARDNVGMIRMYRKEYLFNQRSTNRHRTLYLSARELDNDELEFRLREHITERESPTFRRIFSDLCDTMTTKFGEAAVRVGPSNFSLID